MNDYYTRFIGRGDKIAVAVSGGRDSVALLHFLLQKSKEGGFTVLALNVEHGIRGETSLRDSAFVKELCSAWHVPLLAFSVDAPARARRDKLSMEQAARAERYRVFDAVLSEKSADKIATAHHLGDNAETVLINLFRGASLKGAAGIPPRRNGIIRPFLTTSREEIDEYVIKNNLPFAEDETNALTEITRNFIRGEVMPRLKDKFPEGERAVMRFCEIAREEDDYLEEQSRALITEGDGAYFLPVTAPKTLLRRAALLAIKQLGITADYGRIHADGVCRLTEAETGACLTLPEGVVARREYDRIALFAERAEPFAERPFAEGVYETQEGVLTIAACPLSEVAFGDGAFYADADKFEGAAIRTRREGDVFRKFGGKRKKLKEYFIDEKIPFRLRGGIPLIARGKEILFSGREISEDVKLDERTERALKITYETQRRR